MKSSFAPAANRIAFPVCAVFQFIRRSVTMGYRPKPLHNTKTPIHGVVETERYFDTAI